MNLLVQISDEVLGKNAQTVVRDKATGRRRDLDAERAAQAETDAAKAITTAKYDVWNKGQVSVSFMLTLSVSSSSVDKFQSIYSHFLYPVYKNQLIEYTYILPCNFELF